MQTAIPDEGDYFQVELKFAYRRRPPPAPKQNNIHVLVHMGIGMKKLGGVEVPVWVEIAGIIGTVRLRVQAISDPPFLTCVPGLADRGDADARASSSAILKSPFPRCPSSRSLPSL